MITFRVRGRTVSVLYSPPPDMAAAGAKLSVMLDRRRPLEPEHVVGLEAEAEQRRWQVHLPAELYDGRPHHIALEAKSDGRLVGTAAFQFSGAPQLLASTRRTGAAEISPTKPSPTKPGAPAPVVEQPSRAEPVPAPPRRDGREQLADFLRSEFGGDTLERVRGYFGIIDALAPDAEPALRREHLDSLTERLRLLSKAADDGRPIDASIVIPVFNSIGYTIACVLSLLEHGANSRFEIIIADDASSDETAAVFGAIGGVVRCVTQETNQGFSGNCNRAAREARGRYVALLNNDTFVLEGWLDELLAPFECFSGVGLTGSKLLMPDGTLQEAGGIIWRDASGWNFGRTQDPTLPEFNYVKDVDYVSGASLAVPKAVWDEIGGFDERYRPAYFEDSDLAFTLRAKGLRTLYAPGSALIHHEGVSNGTDLAAGIKAYQVTNTPKFIEKWQDVLATEHFPNGEEVFLARDRSRQKKHMLVIDHYVPQPDRDAGSRTLFSYIKMFVEGGLQVSFWPDNLYRDKDYLKALQDLGVEVLYGSQLVGRFPEWITERGRYLDYVFLSRAHVAINYIDHIRDQSAAKLLYYGHDLAYERLKQEYALTGKTKIKEEIDYWYELEQKIWRKTDVLYYPAQEEVEAVEDAAPDKTVRKFSIYVYPESDIAEARVRLDRMANPAPTVMFVGGYRHRPNVDGALWFVREILPLVQRRIPEIRTILAGSFPPPAITRLASGNVLVTGYIADPVLEWLYRSANAAILPLRFGGGVKGKLIEALRFGVPVVTTRWGAQGLPQPEDRVALAGSPEEFAERLIETITMPEVARERARNGLDFIEQEFGYTAVARRMALDIPELGRLGLGEVPQGDRRRGGARTSEAGPAKRRRNTAARAGA
ncbi:MAG TPA: glycosyltransferase [Stellaceae bacterium]